MPYGGLFGRRFRLGETVLKPEEAPKQGGTEQVRSTGGFMRPFTRKELPRTLQIVGSAMQQIGNPNNRALERFQANEADQMRQQAEDMALNRQTKMEDQQRSQLEEAIKTLPADQQVWARMNPSAFIRALVERQMDPNNGWQVGQGYSRAFRIRPDGTREDGAELPLRPRAPITGYVIPGDAQEWDYSDD